MALSVNVLEKKLGSSCLWTSILLAELCLYNPSPNIFETTGVLSIQLRKGSVFLHSLALFSQTNDHTENSFLYTSKIAPGLQRSPWKPTCESHECLLNWTGVVVSFSEFLQLYHCTYTRERSGSQPSPAWGCRVYPDCFLHWGVVSSWLSFVVSGLMLPIKLERFNALSTPGSSLPSTLFPRSASITLSTQCCPKIGYGVGRWPRPESPAS